MGPPSPGDHQHTTTTRTSEPELSFLGLGLPPSAPSLGLLIANGFDLMMSGRYWVSPFPGLALFVMIRAINLVGDQLRDILNPRTRRWADGPAYELASA